MRIGIMGGTLDPVHRGHVDVALKTMAALPLDRVMLLPAGDPPHKARTTDKQDRFNMAEIAAADHAGLFASDVEIKRDGITYTVDTLTELTERHPEVAWTYIVGADTLNILDTWRGFSRIAQLCDFVAIGRPGCDKALVEARALTLKKQYGARIELLRIEGPDISSTQIRNRVAEGLDIHALVPDRVAKYIDDNGLYLCDYSETQIIEKLRNTLSSHRLTHTLGVAHTAFRLSERFGVAPYRARLAGLLHDCAKSMDVADMRNLVVQNVSDADAAELTCEAILHAPAGMVLAQMEYGVRDQSILNAIRRHTAGGPAMTCMDALIYVSDFIEPGRADFPGLSRAREMAEEDIFAAMHLCATLSVEYLEARGQTVHPHTLELLKMNHRRHNV